MEMIVSIGAMEPYREEASIRSPIFYSAGEMKLSCQQKAAMLCKESVTAGIYLLMFHYVLGVSICFPAGLSMGKFT